MVDEGVNIKRRLKRHMRMTNECNQPSVCVSNATNSTLPDDLKSRIFIGNLNTNVVTKRHLHLIFIQFGDIKAISMHKGYAFIQYGDEMDALNAVFAQDGQLLAGQTMDVNLVTEPKPHQRASKTLSPTCSSNDESDTNTSGTNNNNFSTCINDNDMNDMKETSQESIDSDSFIQTTNNKQDSIQVIMSINSSNNNNNSMEINSEEDEKGFCGNFEGHSKRAKVENINQSSIDSIDNQLNDNESNQIYDNRDSITTTTTTTTATGQKITTQTGQTTTTTNFLTNSNSTSDMSTTSTKRLRMEPNNYNNSTTTINQMPSQDILICGNCRTLFTSLNYFIQHKRGSRCRLRFVCHCHAQQQIT